MTEDIKQKPTPTKKPVKSDVDKGATFEIESLQPSGADLTGQVLSLSSFEIGEPPALQFFKLHDNVEIPYYATDAAACFDLQAFYEHAGDFFTLYLPTNQKVERQFDVDAATGKKQILIRPLERVLVPTGLIFDTQFGYSVNLHPRSSTPLKQGLTLANCTGIIDSDYVNEVFIVLINLTEKAQYITQGERVAQAELKFALKTRLQETKIKPSQKTNRTGGFGSTNKVN